LYKEIHDLQLVDHARFAEEMEELEELETSEADERHTLS